MEKRLGWCRGAGEDARPPLAILGLRWTWCGAEPTSEPEPPTAAFHQKQTFKLKHCRPEP